MLNKIRQHLRKINDSYEFKPLLSEIEESPVSPLGRFTFWNYNYYPLAYYRKN